MNPSANVHSSETIVHFQASLTEFRDQAKEALATIEADIRRTQEYLDEMHSFWQGVIRKAEDEVMQATLELKRKKMQKIGDRPVDTTDQEVALRKARAKLEYAEEKLDKVKHWSRSFPDSVLDYEGPARQLMTCVENQIPKMTALLAQKVESLEGYQRLG